MGNGIDNKCTVSKSDETFQDEDEEDYWMSNSNVKALLDRAPLFNGSLTTRFYEYYFLQAKEAIDNSPYTNADANVPKPIVYNFGSVILFTFPQSLIFKLIN